MWIPNVRAEDYYFMHEYRLETNGKIYDPDSVEVTDDLGWKYSGMQWKVSGNWAADGVFYIKTNASISGNPGEATDLWEATLITKGTITFTGTPFMEARYGGILIVAEGDMDGDGVSDSEPVIELSGTPSQAANYQGAILSAGDLKVKGNPGIEGCLVAEGGIPIGGNPTITYNGARYKFPYMRYQMCAWRERGFRIALSLAPNRSPHHHPYLPQPRSVCRRTWLP